MSFFLGLHYPAGWELSSRLSDDLSPSCSVPLSTAWLDEAIECEMLRTMHEIVREPDLRGPELQKPIQGRDIDLETRYWYNIIDTKLLVVNLGMTRPPAFDRSLGSIHRSRLT